MQYELKLDIDRPKIPEKQLAERLMSLHRFLQFTNPQIVKRRTKHGWHIRIYFQTEQKLDNVDIVFFQLFLGSDGNREMFNFLRVKSGCKHWNVLFSGKVDAKGKLLSKET